MVWNWLQSFYSFSYMQAKLSHRKNLNIHSRDVINKKKSKTKMQNDTNKNLRNLHETS